MDSKEREGNGSQSRPAGVSVRGAEGGTMKASRVVRVSFHGPARRAGWRIGEGGGRRGERGQCPWPAHDSQGGGREWFPKGREGIPKREKGRDPKRERREWFPKREKGMDSRERGGNGSQREKSEATRIPKRREKPIARRRSAVPGREAIRARARGSACTHEVPGQERAGKGANCGSKSVLAGRRGGGDWLRKSLCCENLFLWRVVSLPLPLLWKVIS